MNTLPVYMPTVKPWITFIKRTICAVILLGNLLLPQFVLAKEDMAVDIYERGQVTRVEKEEETVELNEPLITQTLTIKLISGAEKNKEVVVENQIRGTFVNQKKMAVGQTVIVDKNVLPDGTISYYVTEPFRLPALAWLAVLFFVVTVVTAGRRGLFAFLGLGATLLIIGAYIIPQISAGGNPFLVCIIGSALIASVSLGLGHGFKRTTGIALLSILITITLALGLSYLIVHVAHLFGLGSEEAYYLQFGLNSTINLRGLLLGGIVIGVLGVLDDVVTAQVAAVAELRAANASLSAREIYVRASRIGQEHIVAVVNTLVLAYVGAAFPLVLMFQTFTTPWWVTMNTELISEEIVRTLIGSISLVAAVPIATTLAVWFYHRKK